MSRKSEASVSTTVVVKSKTGRKVKKTASKATISKRSEKENHVDGQQLAHKFSLFLSQRQSSQLEIQLENLTTFSEFIAKFFTRDVYENYRKKGSVVFPKHEYSELLKQLLTEITLDEYEYEDFMRLFVTPGADNIRNEQLRPSVNYAAVQITTLMSAADKILEYMLQSALSGPSL